MSEFSFGQPWMLLLALLLPLLLWLRYFRRSRFSSVRYSDGNLLDGLGTSWAVIAHRLLPVLFACGVLALILALAQPRQGMTESRESRDVVDIVLVVDVSRSMEALDFSTESHPNRNRLDAVKDVVAEFVDKRPDDRFSVIAFAVHPYTMAPLTFDKNWLKQRIKMLSTDIIESEATGIGNALGTAVASLDKSESKSKVIILLTDGVNNTGTITPEQAAELAKLKEVKVHTIGAGREGLVPVPMYRGSQRLPFTRQMQSQIDEETLVNIASVTGGQFFRAQDYDSLTGVYDEIDKMERYEIETEHFTSFVEKFQWFAIPGLLLIALEFLLSFGRVGRLT